MITSDGALKRGVGRPRVGIKPEQVDELKRQDVSWRRIGKVLGIGTATAMRLFKSLEGTRPNTQDLRPKTHEEVQERLGPEQKSGDSEQRLPCEPFCG